MLVLVQAFYHMFEKMYTYVTSCFALTYAHSWEPTCMLFVADCTINMLDYACVDSACRSVVYDTQSTCAIFVTATLNAGMNTV